MNTVWKYPLPLSGGAEFVLEMPENALILHVCAQRNRAHLWAQVDTEQPKERRRFVLAVTGGPVPGDAAWRQHRGTVLLDGGEYVLHLFELFGER